MCMKLRFGCQSGVRAYAVAFSLLAFAVVGGSVSFSSFPFVLAFSAFFMLCKKCFFMISCIRHSSRFFLLYQESCQRNCCPI